MKKHLLIFLLALFTAVFPLLAATKSITFSSANTVNDDPITVSFAQNKGTVAPAFNAGMRLYYDSSNAGNGGSMTVSCQAGYKLTEIKITYTGTSYSYPTNACGSVGSLSNSGTTGTWTAGNSTVTSVELKNTNTTNSQVRFTKIDVSYETSGDTTDPTEPGTDPVDPDPETPTGGDDKEATLNTTSFKGSGTAYAKYNYEADGIKYTSVFAMTSGTMQFNTNNNNGKASAILVSSNDTEYIIKSIDVKFGTAGNGVKIYSRNEGFGDLTLATAPTIPEDATSVESALKANKENIEINAPAFAIYPAGTGVIQVSSVTVHYGKPDGTFVSEPTISCVDNMVTISCANKDASIYYTIDGTTPDKTSEKYGEAFAIESTTTVKAIAYVEDTASKVAEYKAYYIPAGYLTVPQAKALIEDGYEGELTAKGIVSRVTYYNTSYKSVTYYISEDGSQDNDLQVYGGLGLNGEGFDSMSDVAVGATVVVKGNVKMYSGAPEFDTNSIMLEYIAPKSDYTNLDKYESEGVTFAIDGSYQLELGRYHPEISYEFAPEGYISIADDGTITASAVVEEVSVTASWEEDVEWNAGEVLFTVSVTKGKVAAPTANVSDGTEVVLGTSVTFSSTTEGAKIYGMVSYSDDSIDELEGDMPYTFTFSKLGHVEIELYAYLEDDSALDASEELTFGYDVVAPEQTSSYTITFDDNFNSNGEPSDLTSDISSDALLNYIITGKEYVASASGISKVYKGKSGLKFGNSSQAGSVTLNLADAGKVNVTKIVVSAKEWENQSGVLNNAVLKINGVSKTINTAELADYEYNVSGSIESIKLETDKPSDYRAYVKGLTVYYESAPEELYLYGDFGTYSSWDLTKGVKLEALYAGSSTFHAKGMFIGTVDEEGNPAEGGYFVMATAQAPQTEIATVAATVDWTSLGYNAFVYHPESDGEIAVDGMSVVSTNVYAIESHESLPKYKVEEPGLYDITVTFEGATPSVSEVVASEPTQTGIENVSASESSDAVFYNMQGVRVDNPSAGMYIRRQGSTVSKVMVK